MPAAVSTAKRVIAPTTNKRQNASTQARYASSKLIQNLGSNREQYKFNGKVRDVHGRD